MEANILGVINNQTFCLDLYERTKQDNLTCPAGTRIHINNRVIQDGFGESCDDTKEPGVNINAILNIFFGFLFLL